MKDETNISIRIDKTLYSKLVKEAKSQDRTLASFIRYQLRKLIESEVSLCGK